MFGRALARLKKKSKRGRNKWLGHQGDRPKYKNLAKTGRMNYFLKWRTHSCDLSPFVHKLDQGTSAVAILLTISLKELFSSLEKGGYVLSQVSESQLKVGPYDLAHPSVAIRRLSLRAKLERSSSEQRHLVVYIRKR